MSKRDKTLSALGLNVRKNHESQANFGKLLRGESEENPHLAQPVFQANELVVRRMGRSFALMLVVERSFSTVYLEPHSISHLA